MAAWFEEALPADLTYEADGRQLPLREHQFVKGAPDLPTFAKQALDAHREVGARIPLRFSSDPAKRVTEIEQWKKDHLPKLYDNGILSRPPSDPKEYDIKKPDDLHEGVNWSDERAGKFAQLGVKHGISKDAMNELLQLHREAVAGTADTLKTNYDETMLALKNEFGADFDSRMEMAKRFNRIIFKTPEEVAFMEETGLGNHPILAGILMRLAPFAQNDASLVEQLQQTGGPVENTEEARNKIRDEVADIYYNPQNPRHQGYLSGDPAVERYIQSKYEQLYGTSTPQAVP